MSAYPVLSVRAGFASNPFATSIAWTEIGQASAAGPGGLGWVRSVQTKRGRDRLLAAQAQFDAGTATVTVDNRDRRFDPSNTAGPYFPNVQPRKLIQVRATWAGTTYTIFTGLADDWPQNWPGFVEGEVKIPVSDLFKMLSNTYLTTSGYQAQIAADGAQGYWQFGDAYGSPTAVDSSGNGYTATMLGTSRFDQAGPLNSSEVTGVDLSQGQMGQALIPSAAVKTGSEWTTWSVEGWYQLAQTGTAGTLFTAGYLNDPVDGQFTGDNDNIVSLAVGGGGGANPITLMVRGGNINAGPSTYHNSISTVPGPNDTNWHHLVLTCNEGSTNFGFRLYIDGEYVAFTSISQPYAITYPTKAWTLAAWGGVFGGGTFIVPDFPGLLAQCAFYPTVLTASEVLNHFQLADWPAEYTGQRVSRILGLLGIPSNQTNVQTGYSYCQADDTDETQTAALDYLQTLEQTEQGELYVDPAGRVTFNDRYQRYRTSTPTGTLGDGGSAYPSEIPYELGGVTLNFDLDNLVNMATVTRENGRTQNWQNTASLAEFGQASLQGLDDLLLAYDYDAWYCAQWVVADNAFPQYRVGSITLDPFTDTRLWPLVLGYDVGACITVNKHNIPGGGPPISLVLHLEGVGHDIKPPRQWITTWSVSINLAWVLLDDPNVGFLDGAPRWGW